MPIRADLGAAALAVVLLGAPARAADVPPEPGFIEYLGLLVEEDGEYLDPLDLENTDLPGESRQPGADRDGDHGGEAAENDHEDEN